jgi:hypothetical protein
MWLRMSRSKCLLAFLRELSKVKDHTHRDAGINLATCVVLRNVELLTGFVIDQRPVKFERPQ